MPTRNYTPPGIKRAELEEIFRRALPDETIVTAEIAGHGSTNLVYKVACGKNFYILKIAYQPSRLPAKSIEKEVSLLQRFAGQNLALPIPQIIWSGFTPNGLPALVETFIFGEHLENLLPNASNRTEIAQILGKFTAEFHQSTEPYISEFKADRPDFPSFAEYTASMLKKWEPNLRKARHIPQTDISKACRTVSVSLPFFAETRWPYVHADISQENLFGKLENGKIELTGLCDFENVMTAPPEYEFATLSDTIFIFYPEMEQPFYESYARCRPLPNNFEKRLRAVNLFRALRYIRRSVEYNETHYFEHDLKFLNRWIKKTA
ncbi:MAG: phosphotransferase [Patescibacteria group bacterium]|nr:phosphotransferase [Patescibacteria group bacterium]